MSNLTETVDERSFLVFQFAVDAMIKKKKREWIESLKGNEVVIPSYKTYIVYIIVMSQRSEIYTYIYK